MIDAASHSPGADPDLDELAELLRDGGVGALLDHGDGLVAAAPVDDGRRLIRDALRLSASALADDPSQLPAQLLARLGEGHDPSVRELTAQARRWDRGPWLCPLTASLANPGGPLVLSLRGHPDHITAVAITPDGRHAASGSVPRTVKVWDLERGTELRTLTGSGRFGQGEGYGQDVDALAISADATRVAATNGDGRIHVWDPTSGAQLQAVAGCDDENWRSTLSPDGRWAASAFLSSILPMIENEQRGTIDLWDLERGEVARSLRSRSSPVAALALTRDAGKLLTWTGDLRVRDVAGDTVRTLEGPTSGASALAVTPDGRRAVAGHRDGTVTVWDLESQRAPAPLSGHGDRVGAVAITADGQRAVSGSDDSTVRVWDLEHMTEVGILSGHVGEIRSVAVNADGSRAVSGGADRVLRVWNLERLAQEASPAHHLPVQTVTISDDGRRATAVSADGTSEVWRIDENGSSEDDTGDASGQAAAVPAAVADRIEALEREEAPGAAVHKVLAVAVSTDRQRAVCATQRWTVLSGYHRWAVDTGTVRVWDLGPDPVGRVLAERSQNVVGFQQTEHHRDVAITPDGRYGAGVGDDRTVTVWDLDTASPVASFTADSPLRTCAISPDGRTVVAGGETGDVHLLRVTARR